MSVTGLEGLGESIKTHTDFMVFVLKRAQILFKDLEKVLLDDGVWAATGNALFFSSYSTTLDTLPERLPSAVGKLYAQLTPEDTTRRVAAVETHFSPTCAANEALMVLGLAEFPRPVSFAEASNQYDAGNFVETLYGATTPLYGDTFRLESGQHPSVFAGASTIRVVCWPLVQITSADWLEKTVLGTLKGWGQSGPTTKF